MKKILCLSLAVLTLCLCIVPFLNNTVTGDSSSVRTSSSAVIKDLTNEYSGKNVRNVTVTSGTETKLNTQNYNQTRLKNYYNNINSSAQLSGSGICWASAATSVIKYNGATNSEEIVCYNLLEYALSKKWITTQETGLNSSHNADLITKGFSQNNLTGSGNTDYYNVYKTLKSEVNANRAVIFCCVGHAMTGCGYVTYSISYQEKNLFGKYKNKTATQDYVIVNDTWSDTRQYSYFPEDEIGTNIFTRWNFALTKIR